MKKYTIYVKRGIMFEAKISAKTIEEAFNKATLMSAAELWNTPGEIIDDERKITAVFE